MILELYSSLAERVNTFAPLSEARPPDGAWADEEGQGRPGLPMVLIAGQSHLDFLSVKIERVCHCEAFFAEAIPT